MVGYVLLIGRLIPAIGKLPSDPGYDFMFLVERDGLRSLAQSSEKYIQIAPRMVAWIALWFPISFHAIVLQALALVICAVLGVIIAAAIEVQAESRILGIACGLVFLTIPAASESTIGNAGSLKWPLLAALGVVAVSPRFYAKHMTFTALFTVFVGLSSPMFAVCLIPVAWSIMSDRSRFKSLAPLLVATCCGVAVQGIVWYAKNRQVRIYGNSSQQTPWAGMGAFWYLVWLGPLCAGLVALLAWLVSRSKVTVRGAELQKVAVWLAISSIMLSFLVYLSAGIKDSAAVATQSMAWTAVVIVASTWIPQANAVSLRLGGYLAIAAVILFALKWFVVSPYLSGGPTWRSEIQNARSQCELAKLKQVELHLNLASVNLPCTTVR